MSPSVWEKQIRYSEYVFLGYNCKTSSHKNAAVRLIVASDWNYVGERQRERTLDNLNYLRPLFPLLFVRFRLFVCVYERCVQAVLREEYCQRIMELKTDFFFSCIVIMTLSYSFLLCPIGGFQYTDAHS